MQKDAIFITKHFGNKQNDVIALRDDIPPETRNTVSGIHEMQVCAERIVFQFGVLNAGSIHLPPTQLPIHSKIIY